MILPLSSRRPFGARQLSCDNVWLAPFAGTFGMTSHRLLAVTAGRILRHALGIVLVASAVTTASTTLAHAQALPPNPNGPQANWALFDKFSTANARLLTYSTTVTPRWIGQSDSLFYSWRDPHWRALVPRKRRHAHQEAAFRSGQDGRAADGAPQKGSRCLCAQ